MRRLIIFLLIAGALVWFVQRYHSQHPNGDAFWDFLNGKSSSQSASPGSTPVDRSLNGCRSRVSQVASKVLAPLDQNSEIAAAGASSELAGVSQDLQNFRDSADYANINQAIQFITQALNERAGFLTRYRQSSSNAPSSSSLSASKVKSANGTSMQSNGDFFKNAVTHDWNERCNYYRPSIDRLLVPSQ